MNIGEHWKTIFNTLHDGLIVVDTAGRIVAINPAAEQITGYTAEALELLTSYAWPGNIRELRNTIEYAFVLCPGGNIDVDHLPARVAAGLPEGPTGKENTDGTAKDAADRARLEQTLRQTGWNQSETARLLGVSRVTVWKKIKKYGISRPWAEAGGSG